MKAINQNSYKKALKWIVKILKKKNIKFNILGGLAAYAYGSKRMLVDIDLAMKNKDFQKILPDVKNYIIEMPHYLNQKNWQGYYMGIKYNSIKIEVGGADGDSMLNSRTKKWQKLGDILSRKPVFKKVFGLSLPLIPKKELIAYKEKLMREVDIIDLRNIGEKNIKPQIKAIVFDIGGVMASENNLVDHYIPLCKSLKINKKKFFEIRNKYINKFAKGEKSGRKLITIFSKRLNIPYKKFLQNWIKYKRKSIKKNFELERIIRDLKKKEYRVASLSNAIDIHYKLGKEKGLYNVFNFNILSFKEGFSKPDIRIYKLLLNKLKMPAKEVIFIDDYQICLDGAKKLGINTILFRNNKQLVKDMEKLGVKTR